jgi:copper resistance protein B
MDHSQMDHSQMDHATMNHDAPTPVEYEPRRPVPAVTDADRAAAFRPLHAHAAHGASSHWFVGMDRLEAIDTDEGTGLAWQLGAWVGGDTHRLWLRSEGERGADRLAAADIELLCGRSVTPWWDVLVGVRHDTAPGGSRDFLAVGVQGLAPQKIDVAATVYLGSGGQSALRLEAGRDFLLTQRWIVQPRAELTASGRDDADRGVGAGVNTLELGVRLRYQVTRRFAPYIGLVHERAFAGTADQRRDAGEPPSDTRVVAGVRFWF